MRLCLLVCMSAHQTSLRRVEGIEMGHPYVTSSSLCKMDLANYNWWYFHISPWRCLLNHKTDQYCSSFLAWSVIFIKWAVSKWSFLRAFLSSTSSSLPADLIKSFCHMYFPFLSVVFRHAILHLFSSTSSLLLIQCHVHRKHITALTLSWTSLPKNQQKCWKALAWNWIIDGFRHSNINILVMSSFNLVWYSTACKSFN